jgi:hypothetical protein
MVFDGEESSQIDSTDVTAAERLENVEFMLQRLLLL